MILDSTFLIDFQREIQRRRPAGAHAFLRAHSETDWRIAFISEGEFACGIEENRRPTMEVFLKPYPILPCTGEIAWRYSRVHRTLKQNGNLIGSNDLWIAATALVHDVPVVTRNTDEFRRVPGLTVYDY